MRSERRRRILEQLREDRAGEPTKRLCQVCADVVGVTGAGIMLMAGDVPQGSVCTTDEVSALIEELQYALGEGPCVDAYHSDSPVSEPDLATPKTSRWVGFASAAVEAGVRAVFGYPLQVGAVRLGALNLYRNIPGSLSDDQHADALVMADIAAEAILGLQANAPSGRLAAELEAGGDFQYVIHQATGMVAAQLDISVGQALIRLKAYSFGNDRPLKDVARDVVARKLRFDTPTEQDPHF